MSSAIPSESLAEMLHVERRDDAHFVASLEDFWGAPMGADVWARCALAAVHGCPGSELVSLQGFLPGGLTLDAPLSLRANVRDDGQGVARCELQLSQGARSSRVLACFAAPVEGAPSYQDLAAPTKIPEPESLPSTLETARSEGWPEEYARGPLEFRRIGPRLRDPERGDSYHHLAWLSPRTPLPDGPAIDTAALVFAIGWYPHWEFERRLGPKFAQGRFRPLDWALQIHAPCHFSDWWLLETKSEVAREGRALSTRRLYARDGQLLASASGSALVATT